MDLTIILGLLSIVLGVLAIYKRKYPGSISFLIEESTDLIDSLIKNFTQINILFDNKPIENKLIYIKGNFINDGTIDIMESMVEKGITISAPQGYKWKLVKITNSSTNFNCNYTIDNNNLTFNFGLFRIKDFFQFESLVETSVLIDPLNTLLKSITFSHRIANIRNIKQSETINYDRIVKKRNFGLDNYLFFAILISLFTVILYPIYENISKTIDINNNYHKALLDTNTIQIQKVTKELDSLVSISNYYDDSKYENSYDDDNYSDNNKIHHVVDLKIIKLKMKLESLKNKINELDSSNTNTVDLIFKDLSIQKYNLLPYIFDHYLLISFNILLLVFGYSKLSKRSKLEKLNMLLYKSKEKL